MISHADLEEASQQARRRGTADALSQMPKAFPVGSVFITVVSTDPSTLLGYGTWARLGQGRVLIGQNDVDTDFDVAKEIGGSKTHTHAGHAEHIFTQPGIHSAHVFTQPNGHSNHVVTQPNNHVDVVNHVHRENRNSANTGALDGWAAGDTSTATPLLTGYSTANPTSGGVAAQVHAGAAVDAHSAHAGGAVDAHSAHIGGAVDTHSAHDTPTALPPYLVAYFWERVS